MFKCPKCDYEKQTTEPLSTLQKVVERPPQEDIVVIGKKDLINKDIIGPLKPF